MKKTFIIILIFFSSICTLNAQSNKIKGEALEKALKTSTKVYDLISILTGNTDAIEGLCSLLGGNPAICQTLKVGSLNEGEERELERRREQLKQIKEKEELDSFLRKNGIDPKKFYETLYNFRTSDILLNGINNLKDSPKWENR